VHVKILEQACEALRDAAQQSSSDDDAAADALIRRSGVQ
jgi:hypothetical protein